MIQGLGAFGFTLLDVKVRVLAIARNNDAIFNWRPRDSKRRIIPAHAPPGLRNVTRRYLVENFRVVLQRLKPVREFFGDVKHQMIAVRELDCDPLPERRGTRADVYGHVIDRPAGAADQFCLAVWRGLVVQSPKRPAFSIEGNITFDNICFQTVFLKLGARPGVRKEPSLILDFLGLDNVHTANFSFSEDHCCETDAS